MSCRATSIWCWLPDRAVCFQNECETQRLKAYLDMHFHSAWKFMYMCNYTLILIYICSIINKTDSIVYPLVTIRAVNVKWTSYLGLYKRNVSVFVVISFECPQNVQKQKSFVRWISMSFGRAYSIWRSIVFGWTLCQEVVIYVTWTSRSEYRKPFHRKWSKTARA